MGNVKRMVYERPDGVDELIGLTDTQPPALLDHKGVAINLVKLSHNRFYVYRPLMSPSEVMAAYRGDGTHTSNGPRTFKPGQK